MGSLCQPILLQREACITRDLVRWLDPAQAPDVDADIGVWWSTTTMESLRFGVDHNAILWCRQLVRELKHVIVAVSRHCGSDKQPCRVVAEHTRLPTNDESWSAYAAPDSSILRPWTAMVAALPLRWGPSIVSAVFMFAAGGHLYSMWCAMPEADAPTTATVVSVAVALLVSGFVDMTTGLVASVDPSAPMDAMRVRVLAWFDFGDDVRFLQSCNSWDMIGIVGVVTVGWTLHRTLAWLLGMAGCDSHLRQVGLVIVPSSVLVLFSLLGQIFFPGADLVSVAWNVLRLFLVLAIGFVCAKCPAHSSTDTELLIGIGYLSTALPWCIDGVFRIPDIGMAYLLVTHVRFRRVLTPLVAFFSR